MLDETDRGAAVLVSGGIDSAVLTFEMARRFARVYPLFVRFGLRWEDAELAAVRAFLGSLDAPGMAPLVVLDEPVDAVYGDHWSLGGPVVPGVDAPDESVYLPGRNVLLIAKAAVWCQVRGIGRLALGTLAGNPFPDNTAAFFEAFQSALGLAAKARVELLRPFERMTKADVMRLGAALPLGLTFSCLDPVAGRHCGSCNKCGERRRAFESAGRADPACPTPGHATARRGMSCIE